MSEAIEAILAERKSTHGDFIDHANYSQELKKAMRSSKTWDKLDVRAQESLEMIQHKIGRILAGNWKFKDHWTDIIGYARLIEKEL